jgi:hypothetical protein
MRFMWIRSATAALLVLAIALFARSALRSSLFGATGLPARGAQPDSRPPDANATPVLVELFTSEGCSSCPPADDLLSQLGRKQPVAGVDIIALEEHVTYWDDGGWKDPFSSEAFTDRQREYAQAFGGKEIYTPQMVVDGSWEFVGSSSTDALRAIRNASHAAKPAIHLSWQEHDSLAIRVDPMPSAHGSVDAQLFLVIAESMLHSDVKRGENGGRSLTHDGVVRQIAPVAQIKSLAEEFSSTFPVHAAREWNRSNLRAVVFLQDRSGRHIAAAATLPFPPEKLDARN